MSLLHCTFDVPLESSLILFKYELILNQVSAI